MGAPAACVAGGPVGFAGAGELGELVGVRLDQVGAGGDAPPQGFPAGVEEYGDGGRPREPDELRVRPHVDARRQAAAEGDRPGPVEEFGEAVPEDGPLAAW